MSGIGVKSVSSIRGKWTNYEFNSLVVLCCFIVLIKIGLSPGFILMSDPPKGFRSCVV